MSTQDVVLAEPERPKLKTTIGLDMDTVKLALKEWVLAHPACDQLGFEISRDDVRVVTVEHKLQPETIQRALFGFIRQETGLEPCELHWLCDGGQLLRGCTVTVQTPTPLRDIIPLPERRS